MAVCVLDRRGKPLMPCSEKRARLLLTRGRARVHRVVPFVIRLVDRERANCTVQPLRVKLTAGSKTTGLALVREDPAGAVQHVRMLAEIQHRGPAIRKALLQRRGSRQIRSSPPWLAVPADGGNFRSCPGSRTPGGRCVPGAGWWRRRCRGISP